MRYHEAKAEAKKLIDMGYIAYPSIAIFGKTEDEHIYSVTQNGFIPDNRCSPPKPYSYKYHAIAEASLHMELDEFVF